MDALYKGILKNYSIKLADTTNVYDFSSMFECAHIETLRITSLRTGEHNCSLVRMFHTAMLKEIESKCVYYNCVGMY